ncbi:MAG: transglutaminase family protein [Opitutales bacterium]|nr:transglutaminase family protein [Opitutales bacterium]
MRFKVSHLTSYDYKQPVSESVGEMRVCPSDSDGQLLMDRDLRIEPQAEVRAFRDFFGNCVECFSIPFRHDKLTVESSCIVETQVRQPRAEQLEVTLGEARQILRGRHMDPHLFVRPSRNVPVLRRGHIVDLPEFRQAEALGVCLLRLNQWIYKHFRYVPGATHIETPVDEVLQKRHGVCQDFSHVFLAVCRGLGLPARYVSGYIEAHEPGGGSKLVGAMASHAWVEVLLPGHFWWGWDPTNNCQVGERHVRVAVGRDFSDVSPLRGTYRGVAQQNLRVEVRLERV